MQPWHVFFASLFRIWKRCLLLKRRNLLQDLSARQSDLDPQVPWSPVEDSLWTLPSSPLLRSIGRRIPQIKVLWKKKGANITTWPCLAKPRWAFLIWTVDLLEVSSPIHTPKKLPILGPNLCRMHNMTSSPITFSNHIQAICRLGSSWTSATSDMYPTSGRRPSVTKLKHHRIKYI